MPDDLDYLPLEGSEHARRAVEAFWSSDEGKALHHEIRVRAELDRATELILVGDYETVEL